MFKIYIGPATALKEVIVSGEDTLGTVLQNNGINFASGVLQIDGQVMGQNDLEKTLAELQVSENATISSTQKMASA